MKITDLPLDGLKLIELDVHGDERGFFVERYHQQKFAELGFAETFVQDNHSRSSPGILRGLHYQHTPPQGKLVGVTRGTVLDVAVDIRPTSPTYGQHHAEELSGSNGLLLWVPPGFAHGFSVLGDELVDIFYKVSGNYNPEGEGGIAYDDPELAIDWKVETSIVSERDENLQSFADYRAHPAPW